LDLTKEQIEKAREGIEKLEKEIEEDLGVRGSGIEDDDDPYEQSYAQDNIDLERVRKENRIRSGEKTPDHVSLKEVLLKQKEREGSADSRLRLKMKKLSLAEAQDRYIDFNNFENKSKRKEKRKEVGVATLVGGGAVTLGGMFATSGAILSTGIGIGLVGAPLIYGAMKIWEIMKKKNLERERNEVKGVLSRDKSASEAT